MKPDTTAEKTAASKWTVFKRKIKRILYLIGFVVIIVLGSVIFFRYFYTYSDGWRTGLLQKFSHKGTIFKTYEGEIILSSVAGGNNVVIASEKFLFSVTEKKLARQFDTLQGRNVTVYYRQKKGVLFWKGDTPNLVDSVKLR